MPRDTAFAPQTDQRGKLVRLWHLWRRRASDMRRARQFSDRDLRDLGLTRGDLFREFARPLWQQDH